MATLEILAVDVVFVDAGLFSIAILLYSHKLVIIPKEAYDSFMLLGEDQAYHQFMCFYIDLLSEVFELATSFESLLLLFGPVLGRIVILLKI